jgi:hypothetical protein
MKIDKVLFVNRQHNEGSGKYSTFNRELVLNHMYEFPQTPDPSRPCTDARGCINTQVLSR